MQPQGVLASGFTFNYLYLDQALCQLLDRS